MSVTPFYLMYIRLCDKVGKSPSAVALEIGLQKSTVTRWKRGALPNDTTLLRVSDYFHLPAHMFMENFGQHEKKGESEEDYE